MDRARNGSPFPLEGGRAGDGGGGHSARRWRDDRELSLDTARAEPAPPPSPALLSSRGKGISRATIVAAARGWVGTPYRHQASLKGAGCDCLGLVRGVWRELYGEEPETPPPYRPDWAEIGDRETLLEAARRHLVEAPRDAFRPGDVLLFRMSPDACLKHCAIVSRRRPGDPEPRIVHAYWGRAVVESWLGPWWRRRLAHAFSFPNVSD